jgi:rfaE bifunctional protein nucleotidyltransferase chain/domain
MTKEKICFLDEATARIEGWKKEGLKIVFTNGCFDILHIGHADYLEKAAALGDKLVIGLNSDDSVRRLKGESRPVNPEFARARLLAALQFVDLVVVFEQDTPLELIKTLMPDVLVKGSDYGIENIVGAKEVMANGGEVKTVELTEGFSTTKIIEKAKAPRN